VDYSLEAKIWSLAQAVYSDEDFAELIIDVAKIYKRRPGYFDVERIYASTIGAQGILALRTALEQPLEQVYGLAASNFVLVRAPLRRHLYEQLQRRLIESGYSCDAVLEDRMARDLGL